MAAAFDHNFVRVKDLSDEEIETSFLREVDEALDHPARRCLPEGSVLFREGEPLDGIWIRLAGQVRLYREIQGERVTFHSETVGRIIGLLALSRNEPAYYSCQSVTELTVLFISREQLEEIMDNCPALAAHFTTMVLRSLVRRNRRAVELQIEVNQLYRALADERDHLADTIKQLERAHMRLIESEKMATLGEMSAGVAHELNNPVAAIKRAADFLVEDIQSLLGGGDAAALAMFDGALARPPVSTREEREHRRALAEALGDADTAQRLVKIGITTAEEARAAVEGEALPTLEYSHNLGASVRNIRSCAERISSLVRSLRSYARVDHTTRDDVDLHMGIEDTLRLFKSEMKEVDVIREFGSLPLIEGRAGELNQVWTNLISNAIEAMKGAGKLVIRTDQPDAGHVRIRVIDSGSGISPEHIEKIFEVNFTTRQGAADFGLGIGLPICREIITRHQGSIAVDSEPGRTCFTVTLPVQQSEPDTRNPTPETFHSGSTS